MLTEIENGLVASIKGTPLAKYVKTVEPLPNLDGDSLVKQFAAQAPGIYVALASFPVSDGMAKVAAGVACVARNARGHVSARQGDGKLIGMYEMVGRVAGILDGVNAGGSGWRVTRVDFADEDVFRRTGLDVAIVRIESSGGVALPAVIGDGSTGDLGATGEFQTFDAQFDLPPHAGGEEHDKWLQEPPNYASSAPELTDTTLIQEE